MSADFEPLDASADTLAPSEIESLELFRRSPHPYHRRQHELPILQQSIEASSTESSHTAPQSPDGTIYDDDDDERTRRKTSPSLSESGTEADDEGYGFIKALPAPPLRPRKGLRDVRGTGLDGGATPLLTPSQVDEDGRRFSAEFFRTTKEGARGGEPSPTDDEAKAARQKYIMRRCNEMVRRATETALLAVIGLLAVRGCRCWGKLLQWHKGELFAHAMIFGGALCLYPLRLLYYSWIREPRSNLRFRQRICIPAAFDPAPILYPAILPVIIAISIFASFHAPLLPNILLGLAALPPQLIPYGSLPQGYSAAHWLVSILPLVVTENTDFPAKLWPPMLHSSEHPNPDKGLHPEILASLFALHQALLPPLHYLTTTSLLPTELHLFSIGLINLLLFATSPQTSILKTLLWLGGVGLFVTCGKVLKWGVALSRIPRWRFRRVGQIIKTRQSFIQTLAARSQDAQKSSPDSDADDDENGSLIKTPLKKTNSLRVNIMDSIRNNSVAEHGDEVHSATDAKKPSFEGSDGKFGLTTLPSRRRNTLPTSISPQKTTGNRQTHRRRSKSVAQSYLSLTAAQAAFRKWAYAGYFYLVVVVMILGPIRHYIGKYALSGIEPFGWALGYLLGHIQRLRFEVLNWDLDWWIALPPLVDPDSTSWPQHMSPVEHFRRVVVGEANTRLLLCAYCASIIIIGLIIVLSLSSVVEVDTRRKVFHGMMVAMLLPTIYIDPCFVALALTIVLAIFLLLDLIRASQLPPLSRPLATFLTPYVDGRDLRGPVVVSHIFLLIGCAIPLWLSLAAVERAGNNPWVGWEVQSRDVSMVAGVICVGMGDAAASLVGRRFGRRKWPWAGGKSLEGSLAFAGAVTIGLVVGKMWLAVGWGDVLQEKGAMEWVTESVNVVVKAWLCACGASLNEAVLTGGNDNVIVPVVLWILVRGSKL